MKKYKILTVAIILALVSSLAFAQDSEDTEQGNDILISILTNTSYQFDLSQSFASIGNTFSNEIQLLNGLNLGLAFQILFPVGEGVGLGFEVGTESTLIAAIAVAQFQSSLYTLHILPRFIIELGMGGVVSFDILAGVRFALDFISLGSFAVTNSTSTFRFSTDIETRINFALSKNFAFYIGLNYILPFEIIANERNVVVNDLASTGYGGLLTPSLGMRISF